MRGEHSSVGHRRAVQLVVFAFLLGVGFVFLLSRASRADAVELTTPVLPGTTADVAVAAPAAADIAAPGLTHVTVTPPPAPPTSRPIGSTFRLPPRSAVRSRPSPNRWPTWQNPIATPTDPRRHVRAPRSPVSPSVATRASARPRALGPGRARLERRPPPRRSFSPTPAPRPAPPVVPTPSPLDAGRGGGSTQLARTLAVAIALVILFPVGIAPPGGSRCRRCRSDPWLAPAESVPSLRPARQLRPQSSSVFHATEGSETA